MNALPTESLAAVASTSSLFLVAREPESPWDARGFGDLVPPATLREARERRDELTRLLGRERAAAADFLLALADFDRRRGWERLGHASLFAFLTRELGLSSGAAQLRLSAARLLPRHPAVEAALRGGRLCISAVGQLARVLTTENEAAVLPRFFGRSAREAAELAADLLPRAEPPMRALVTPLPAPRPTSLPIPRPMEGPKASLVDRPQHALAPCQSLSADAPHPTAPPPAPLHTYEVPAPDRAAPPRQDPPRLAEIEPLTAELRRLHLTVSKGFLQKVATARTGLSHAIPRASTEQVLEAALDLLLERQARWKARVKRPRRAGKASTPPPTPTSTQAGRPHIPAEIEREVRLRDDDRCQFPLDIGGVCGSTWQVELDHVVPLALGGPTSAANLRCACAHNRYAAELLLGAASGSIRRRGRSPRPSSHGPGGSVVSR